MHNKHITTQDIAAWPIKKCHFVI